jgi:hypothetical protein
MKYLGLEVWLKWYGACPACVNPWV